MLRMPMPLLRSRRRAFRASPFGQKASAAPSREVIQKPARAAAAVSGSSSGCSISAAMLSQAQMTKNPAAMTVESISARAGLSPGISRQRASAPVRMPTPKVCDTAMAAMPARRASFWPTPVWNMRWAMASKRPSAQ